MRLVQAVVAASCATSGWSGTLAPRRPGFSAHADLVGEHRREQVLAAHALQLRRDRLPPENLGRASAWVAFQRQRTPNSGASSSACTSTSVAAGRVQVMRDLDQRKLWAGRQRQHDRVLGRGGLQLESLNFAAEALAQREPQAR